MKLVVNVRAYQNDRNPSVVNDISLDRRGNRAMVDCLPGRERERERHAAVNHFAMDKPALKTTFLAL